MNRHQWLLSLLAFLCSPIEAGDLLIPDRAFTHHTKPLSLTSPLERWGELKHTQFSDERSYLRQIKNRIFDAATFPSHRLPGEFENHQVLLLSCGQLTSGFADTIADIVYETQHCIRTVVLVNNEVQRKSIELTMNGALVMDKNMHFFEVPHNSKWIRDFGPLVVVNKEGEPVIVDNGYDTGRPCDDAIPQRIANFKGVPVETSPLMLEGGNLLSNGQGVCIATRELLHHNAHMSENQIRHYLRRTFGATTTVLLEPLVGEPTGHVDMFATFTDAQTVVVGSYDPLEDPENAFVLDRNALLLSLVKTPNGPLRVFRIPMGSRRDGLWRTYTNCIYANGVLLVPSYLGDPEPEGVALRTFAKLLPNWRIASIDASRLVDSDGALHCISMTVKSLNGTKPHQATHRVRDLRLTRTIQ